LPCRPVRPYNPLRWSLPEVPVPNVINFNGVDYNSVDDMPPAIRAQYDQALGAFVDNNRNGVPDILDNAGLKPIVSANTAIFFNGQVYPSIDALPPDARAQYQQFQAQFDANHNGLPDVMEQLIAGLTNGTAASTSATPDPNAPAFAPSAPIAPAVGQRRPSPYNSPAVVSPEGGFSRPLIIIGLIVTAVLLCGFAFLGLLFFLR
jgi:hypothetical protein